MAEWPKAVRWVHKQGVELTRRVDERVQWTYHFNTDRRKPFFHPMCSSAGVELTACEPADHVWHRGHWFSWKYLNGVNYWEETPDALKDGMTQFSGNEIVTPLADGTMAIETSNEYRPPGGGVVMTDRRLIAVYPPAADGSYALDWVLSFSTTGAPVLIDRTPITPQTLWGGYAGLSWRAALTLGNFRLTDSESRNGADLGQPASWMDLSGTTKEGHAAGMAIFDHPTNLRFPGPWKCFANDGFGYINPAFVMDEPYTLQAGNPLLLRYRVLVHDGPADAARLKSEFEAFKNLTI